MVICCVLVSHGPHVWYAARCWSLVGEFMDFFRLETIQPSVPGQPRAPNIKAPRNVYYFNPA